MKKLLTIFICICAISLSAQQRVIVGETTNANGTFEVTGNIKDATNEEPLIGANIFVKEMNEGASTDVDGNYVLLLEAGEYNLEISYVGYETSNLVVEVRNRGRLDLLLSNEANTLGEIVISSSNARDNVRSAKMGITTLSTAKIEALPQFVGEVDILKSLVLLPGVSSVGEASSGFNIRGGGADQNLILLGGAPIYNPSHLFGFFSSFNSEMIRDATVYKGGIPSEFGGRSSSIIDLDYKKGDLNKWGGNLSIGTISSKLSIGGPIIKDKLSILLGGRASYSSWIFNLIDDPELKNSSADFYDGNAILHYKLNDKHSFDYTFYRSGDNFNLLNQSIFEWYNTIQTATWTSAFSEKAFLNITGTSSKYNFAVDELEQFDPFRYSSDISDTKLALEFNYAFAEGNFVKVGASTKFIEISPGNLGKINPESESNVIPKSIDPENGMESAVYLQHDLDLGKFIGLSYGARLTSYSFLGPQTVYTYDEELPKSQSTILSETLYGDNEKIATYTSVEPRLSLRLSMGDNTSLKFGFNRMSQNIGLISNSTAIAPTDIWKLADSHVKPVIADQYSAGIFQNLFDNGLEISIEGYYKTFDNVLEYKSGADLFLNSNIESELINGIGEAYGAEFYMKKNKGKLTGWLSYTYSRSLRRVIGLYPEETVNNGAWYPSNFDKPHDLTAVGEYKLFDNLKFSAIFTYSVGRPISFPSAKFIYQDQFLAFYDLRNENRVPDYHRLDLSMTWNFNSSSNFLNGDWILSVYNVYQRRNAFSVFFDDVSGLPPQAYRLSALGVAFPSLSYKIKI